MNTAEIVKLGKNEKKYREALKKLCHHLLKEKVMKSQKQIQTLSGITATAMNDFMTEAEEELGEYK